MIHCIGDSHASIFSGLGTREETYMIQIYPQEHIGIDPDFKAYRIGPATAYNLLDKFHIINEIIFKNFKEDRGDKVMFCFGEIDMRIHVGTQLKNHPSKTKDEIIEEIADRYFFAITEMKIQSYNIIILAPSVQSFWNENSDHKKDGFHYNMEFPIVGTNKERNEYTKIFTNLLIEKAKRYYNTIKVISILDEMLDENGETKPDLFMDYLHLSAKVLSLIKSKI